MKQILKFVFTLTLLNISLFSQSFSYWRVNALSSGGFTAISDLNFYDGTSTLIPTTGGTPLASNASFGAAASAFDSNNATFWNANTPATPTSSVWIQYHFSSAVTPASLSITPRSDNNSFGPDSFELQASNDGSTWTHEGYYSVSALWTATSGAAQTFTVDASQGNGTAWRLLVTADQTAVFSGISEWKIYTAAGSQIPWSGGYAVTSSENDSSHPTLAAINGDGNTTFWASTVAPTVPSPQYIEYRFSAASDVTSVCSFSITNAAVNNSPSQFQLQSSPDGSTWTTVGTYTAATWTTAPQTQVFAVSSCSHSTATMILQ